MEKVAFLIEGSGARVTCLLNPESLTLRRSAGLRSLPEAAGLVAGQPLSDDPLFATGGGVTELELELLFDTEIARSLSPRAVSAEAEPVEEDVRDMTRPLWQLAEATARPDATAAAPVVRLIWGRAWNIPGVVTAVAERLERFTRAGLPQRSWVRMRLRRVAEPEQAATTPAAAPLAPAMTETELLLPAAEEGLPPLRHDLLGGLRYGDPAKGRLILELNGIEDPFDIPEGTVLRLPDLPAPAGPVAAAAAQQ